MIVYHGSNSNFKKLRIAKELVKRQSTLQNEGLGIYFSTSKEIAREYGKYIYTLEINDKYLMDFRSGTVCRLYIAKIAQEIYKKYNVDILACEGLNLEELERRMRLGGLAITKVGRELIWSLDKQAWFYELPEYKRVIISGRLRELDKSGTRAFLFNSALSTLGDYECTAIGIIRDISEDVVRIVSKENSY